MVRVIRGETRMSPRGYWSSGGTVGDQMASRPVNPPGTGSSRRPARKPGGGYGCGADDRRGKLGLVAEHTGSDGAAAGIRGDRAAGGRGRQGLPPGQDDGESEEPGTAELCERARPGPPDREEAAGRRESDLRQSSADPGATAGIGCCTGAASGLHPRPVSSGAHAATPHPRGRKENKKTETRDPQ